MLTPVSPSHKNLPMVGHMQALEGASKGIAIKDCLTFVEDASSKSSMLRSSVSDGELCQFEGYRRARLYVCMVHTESKTPGSNISLLGTSGLTPVEDRFAAEQNGRQSSA